MTPMLERQLQEIERLCKGATEGHWVPSGAYVNNASGFVCHAGMAEDADFIAAARGIVPELVAQIRRLDAIETAAREMRREALGYEDESKRYASDGAFVQARQRYNAARHKLDALLDAKVPTSDCGPGRMVAG